MVVDMLEHDRAEYRHTMGHQHPGFSKTRIQEMFREAGFLDIVYRELPGEPDAKGPGLFVATGKIHS